MGNRGEIKNLPIFIYNSFINCSSLTSVTFEDTSTWYYTKNSDYTDGTVIDVIDPTQNATYLNTNYVRYWYKKQD